ncbi:GtrA family protein [Acidithiobacillus ferriphilus]|uniref:GtrA family protein n=1 Tax=Acidithiobacillus ferriphilus TaxID=1689834 RepID=UPI001C061D69|nr:GtrA family protein [Acidithiobacillus ferriphilus]MBU2785113.1 GtrA family protein [Acidithiobacillus ferriphilus]MBU2831492.1 GtrA family protein [Acidithiobacillus ferriphilus]
MRIFFSRQFIVFILTGGFAAAVNFSSRFFYNTFVDFPMAVTFAYLTGMVTAFVLAKFFVFQQASYSTAKSATLFAIVNIFAFAQTWGVSVFLAYHLLPVMGIHQFDKAIASAVGISIPVFTSFIAHKYITFREVAS